MCYALRLHMSAAPLRGGLTQALALNLMTYHHIIAKVGTESGLRVLFTDLTVDELEDRFIKPYEKGKPFFSGNDLISPYDLRSIQIIRTQRTDEVERDEMNHKERESMDRLSDPDSGIFIPSIGGGYHPEDIAEVGSDITHTLLSRPCKTRHSL